MRLVGDCAAALGPRRAFYSTADHAEDLEAVRQALGFDRIAISGECLGWPSPAGAAPGEALFPDVPVLAVS